MTRLLEQLDVKATTQLVEQFKRAKPGAKMAIIDALEHYLEVFQKAPLEQAHDPGGVALGVHIAMDPQVQAAVARPPGGREVSCRRGCSHCCHLQVGVFPDEAVLALAAAEAAGLELDLERLAVQVLATSVEAWRELSHEDRACVFLQASGDCGIYEHRPMACRKYNVVTAPDLCDTRKHPGGGVSMLVCAMAEVIASAAHTTWGRQDFSAALLQVLKVREVARSLVAEQVRP